MGIRTEEKQIGENVYRVTTLGAKAGRDLLVRLVKIAGPTIGEIVKGIDATAAAKGSKKGEGFDLGDVGLDAVASALEKLSESISERDFAYLSDTLATRTEIVYPADGGRAVPLANVYDNHFAGSYGELFGWLAFALGVNYQSFFGGSTGGALLANLRKLKA